jgi:hypothetical protein
MEVPMNTYVKLDGDLKMELAAAPIESAVDYQHDIH